jgi:hypothetical protein
MPRAKAPATVRAEVTKGHREGLVAMRDKLAAAMDEAEPSVIAQVAARLQAVLKELSELDAAAPPEVSSVDDLLGRRRAASGSQSSSGRRRNVRAS